jgi:hypothetical protein
MTFEFDYRQPSDMSAFKVISEGEGYFKIMDAKEDVSKSSGKPMLVLTHRLQNDKGESTLYMQYISHNEYAAENIYRICEAAGKVDMYTACNGRISAVDLMGLKGRCKIKTESDEKYGDKSKIGRFIAFKPMQEDVSNTPGFEDETLPF